MNVTLPLLKNTILLATCISLTACFHNEADVEPNTAFSNAFTQISNVSNKTEVIISEQTDNSDAYKSFDDFSTSTNIFNSIFAGGMANNSSSSAIFFKPGTHSNSSSPTSHSTLNIIQQKILNSIKRHTSTIDNSIARQKITSRFSHEFDTNNGDMNNSESFSPQEIENLLNELFNPPTVNGNTYTYTLKNDTCSGDQECLDFLTSFKMELIIISSTSGTINLKINNITTTTFEYSPTLVSLELFLEGVKELSLLIDDSNNSDPATTVFTGSFKMSVELISDTEVEIIASIPQAINIVDQIDGDPVEFSFASTSKLFALNANSTENTASLELGFGMLYAKYMGDDYFDPSVQEISLKALTGLFELDANNDSIIASNIGIGDEPFTLDIDDTNAITIEANTFGFDIAGDTPEVSLTSDFELNYSVLNVNGELGDDVFDLADDSSDSSLTGELIIKAPSGTVLVEVDSGNYYTDITKILSGGPVTMTGTGYFTSDFTANSGQCINSTDDQNNFGDGTTITDCL